MTDQHALNRAVGLARSPETRNAAVKAARAHGREVARLLRVWAVTLPVLNYPAHREARKLAQRALRIDAEYAAKRGRAAKEGT